MLCVIRTHCHTIELELSSSYATKQHRLIVEFGYMEPWEQTSMVQRKQQSPRSCLKCVDATRMPPRGLPS